MGSPRPLQRGRFGKGSLVHTGAVFISVVICRRLDAQVSLPDAPPPVCPRILTGAVVDTDGDEIPFAQIRVLALQSRTAGTSAAAGAATSTGAVLREREAAPDGSFLLEDLPSVPCNLQVSAKGFLSRTLRSPEDKVVVELSPAETADVTVTSTQEEIAVAQLLAEEHQMIAGVIPNFYVAYDFHAVPLNKRQKFQLAYKSLINPYTNLINAGVAGLEQADNALPGYGQGAEGYGKRFAAQTADTAIATVLSGAVLPILFRQDPRYFYMGHGTVLHRTLYALSTAVIARGDNGHWQPAYASIAGDFGAGAISNLYYPRSNRSDGTVALYNGLISTGLDGVGNVVQEFVFKHFTPHAGAKP